MISPDKVSAVVVTRGNVDLDPVLYSLGFFGEVIVWDNSVAIDLAVYGRYRAIRSCASDVIYVQDDDCVLTTFALTRICDAYQPEKLVANMPEPFRQHYADSCLVGFGAIFDRGLPNDAFERFYEYEEPGELVDPGTLDYPAGDWLARHDDTFARTCDVVFTAMTCLDFVDVPYENRDFATGPDRMYRQDAHVGERSRMLERARRARL